jgi:hypothetical protein
MTTTALTRTSPSNPSTSMALSASIIPFEAENFTQLMVMAEQMASAQLLPQALRQKPADLILVMMKGRELGLSPMQSIGGIHIIDGKPTLSADMMVGLVKRSKACRYFRLVESSATQAAYETLRDGEPAPTRMTFTFKEAQAAGLTGRGPWKAYPAAMLRARCSAALARAVYPDVVGGVYDPDELDRSATTVDAAPVMAGGGGAPANDEPATVDTQAEVLPPTAPPAPTPAPPAATAAPAPPSDDEQSRVAALLERIRTATAEDMDATANGGSALLREVAGWPAGDARNALVAAGKRRRAELADLERFAREQQTGGAP